MSDEAEKLKAKIEEETAEHDGVVQRLQVTRFQSELLDQERLVRSGRIQILKEQLEAIPTDKEEEDG